MVTFAFVIGAIAVIVALLLFADMEAFFLSNIALLLLGIVLIFGGMLYPATVPLYTVSCDEVVYENAMINVEHNYLRVRSEGLTYYEAGPCTWEKIR